MSIYNAVPELMNGNISVYTVPQNVDWYSKLILLCLSIVIGITIHVIFQVVFTLLVTSYFIHKTPHKSFMTSLHKCVMRNITVYRQFDKHQWWFAKFDFIFRVATFCLHGWGPHTLYTHLSSIYVWQAHTTAVHSVHTMPRWHLYLIHNSYVITVTMITITSFMQCSKSMHLHGWWHQPYAHKPSRIIWQIHSNVVQSTIYLS